MTADTDAMYEAVEWLVRLHQPRVDGNDLVEWTLWYEADERHQRAFEQMRHLWSTAGTLAEGPEGPARIERLLAPQRAQDVSRRALGPRLALAASAATALLGLAWLSYRRLSAPPPLAAAAPLVRQMTLPDGTSVELAPGTRIAVRYTSALRRVALFGGEAYFAVRHDPARPFLVTVGGLTVRDVGTAFNVHEAGGRTVVTVVRGEVEVSRSSGAAAHGGSGMRVSAGEEVRWERRARLVVKRADAGRALAWRQGRLEYIDEPLSSVIADIDRYSRYPVVIDDPAVGRLAFTGTVFTRHADQWVRALPGEFPVRLVSHGGHSLLLESLPDKSR